MTFQTQHSSEQQPALRSPTSIIPNNPFSFDQHLPSKHSSSPSSTPSSPDPFYLAMHRRTFAPALAQLPAAADLMRAQLQKTAAQARRTMFLIDWDDTCCATTYLERLGLMSAVGIDDLDQGAAGQRAVAIADWLLVLETRVLAVLKTAVRLGTAVIVTNAGDGWVELSSARFLPAVKAFLDQHHASVKIISARARYIDAYRQFPWKWKALTFVDILSVAAANTAASAVGNHADDGKLHVVVLGDSPGDTYAAYDSADSLAKMGLPVMMKIVKFLERPAIDQLCKQLAVLLDHLVVMTRYNGYFLVSMSNEKERQQQQQQQQQQVGNQENVAQNHQYAQQIAHEDQLELQKQRLQQQQQQQQQQQHVEEVEQQQQQRQQQGDKAVLQVMRAAHVINSTPSPQVAAAESNAQLAAVAATSAPLAAAV